MRSLIPLVLGAAILFGAEPGFRQVNAVYLLPMTGGLDQHLAAQLTRHGVYRVVTDARKADAVLTDHIGASFEQRMAALTPAPVDEAAPAKAAEDEKKAAEPAKTDAGADPKSQTEAAATNTELKGDTYSVPLSTLTRGRGNIFLVDKASGAVLWSRFASPRDRSPEALSRVAEDIARELKRAAMGKK